MGRGFKVIHTYEYGYDVGGFLEGLDTLRLNIVDAITVACCDDGEECILWVNQAVF